MTTLPGIEYTNYTEAFNNVTFSNVTINNSSFHNGTTGREGYPAEHVHRVPFTTGLPPNSTFNASLWTTEEPGSDKICETWLEAQHALFQLANLCFAISFLTPSSFKYHCLFLRSLLLLGFSLFIFWSGLVVCMLDVLGWNIAFFIINICHITYLAYSTYPVKFHRELEDLYVKIFKPLKMTGFEFKTLTKVGKRCNLSKGNIYAIEAVTNTSEKLSILLKGRLKVSVDRVFLHYINPNQFADSPEYESATTETNTSEKYQVTIAAVEDSCLLIWPMDALESLLRSNEYFSEVISTLIGKDITHKMYQIQEMLLNRSRDGVIHEQMLTRCSSSILNIRSNLGHSNSERSLSQLHSLDEEYKGIQFSASAYSTSHLSMKTLPSSNTYETSV